MITGRRKSFIKDFEQYSINDSGEVSLLAYYFPEYGLHPRLSKRIDRAGYETVRISTGGKTHTKYLHRLIAEHFVPNPLNLAEVNHRDGNKLNNSPDNLEWVSHRDNVLHAYRTGLNKKIGRTTNVINIETGTIFNSIKEASKYSGIKYSTLKNLLNGNRTNNTSLKVLGKPVV